MSVRSSLTFCSSLENIWSLYSEVPFENKVENEKFKKWDLDCGKIIRIKYFVNEGKKINLKDAEKFTGWESIVIAFQNNSSIIANVTRYEKRVLLCHKEDLMEEYKKLDSLISPNVYSQSSFGFKLSNGGDVLRRDLIVRRWSTDAHSREKKFVISIRDGSEEIILASIKTTQHQSQVTGTKNIISEFFFNVKLPGLALNINGQNLNTVFSNGNSSQEFKLDGEAKEISVFSVFYFEHKESTELSVNEDEIVKKSPKNSKDKIPPKKSQRRVASFTVTSNFLSYDSNKTREELTSGEIVDCIFVECKSSVWPNLNLNIKERVTKYPISENGWEAASVRFPWGHISVKGNFASGHMVDKNVTIHFYSSSILSRVTINFSFFPFFVDLNLDCLDIEWNLKIKVTPSRTSIFVSKSDFWTQNATYKSLLSIIVDDGCIFDENRCSKNICVIISHLINFKTFIRSKVTDFDKLFNKLETFLQAEGFGSTIQSFITGILKINLDSEFVRKTQYFGSMVSQTAKTFMASWNGMKKDLKIKEVLVATFKNLGGGFEASEDEIRIFCNISIATNFLRAVSEKIYGKAVLK